MGTWLPETCREAKLQPADQTPPIQSDKYQYRIDTVISPDDGHMVARNMSRREINILSRIVHLVGFLCKIIFLFFFAQRYVCIETKSRQCP